MILDALVFDMDGLIFDSERVVQRTWNDAGEQLGYGKIGEHIYNTLGFNVKRRKEYFQGVFGQDFPMDDFNRITRARFQEIVAEEGLAMKPGVRELLNWAHSRGIKTAVATSSRRVYSTDLLKRADIWKLLDGAVFGDMVTNAKPDPEIYLTACSLIHAVPARSVALEDAPAGIRSAHAAGMIPVMVPDLVQPDEETLRLCAGKFESLLDVIPYLEDGRGPTSRS
ncbi:MAG TPA: HAD family phosphatase [Candidatus Bariatricus faecipullorum]|nr:HAD family phosphatase [Candidatus Bariatricus faecipullorum]